ncbi:MAG: DUF1015 domain-containing protein [bacterium]|nr:DUF1015 domain-containing protein [bacterium]
MAQIKPFKGIRYNKEKVKPADVVTQPYDKITPAMQADYYNKNPYNIVKLILNKEKDPYTDAKKHLNEWLQNDILTPQDNNPCIYPYFQEYTTPKGGTKTRKGFIALLKLEDFSTKIVLPHERTLSGPKEDRLKLLRATEANMEQIFLLYPDSENSIMKLIDGNIKNTTPLIDVRESYEKDVTHKVWKIDNQDVIAKIQKLMDPKSLLIADGHHRYETSLNYMKENPNAKFIMATFIAIEDPGLLILPTHRAMYGIKAENFIEKAKEFFTVKECANKENLISELDKAKAHSYGLYNGKFYFLTLKDESIIEKFVEKDRTDEYRKLDVTVLHSLIIEKMLGISKEAVARKENIEYLRGLEDGIKGIDNKKYSLFFILNPTKMKEVSLIANKQETMPQKSTDFYPKLISGLVINKL